MILLMYTELPHRKLLMRCQIPGALFTAGVWSLISWGFSYYVDYTMQKSQMYGSLATIMIFLFWIYLMVNIIFLGGQLNSFLYLYVYKEKVEKIKERKMAKKAAKNSKSRKLGYWMDRVLGKVRMSGPERPENIKKKGE
jgi:membrane protein